MYALLNSRNKIINNIIISYDLQSKNYGHSHSRCLRISSGGSWVNYLVVHTVVTRDVVSRWYAILLLR